MTQSNDANAVPDIIKNNANHQYFMRDANKKCLPMVAEAIIHGCRWCLNMLSVSSCVNRVP